MEPDKMEWEFMETYYFAEPLNPLKANSAQDSKHCHGSVLAVEQDSFLWSGAVEVPLNPHSVEIREELLLDDAALDSFLHGLDVSPSEDYDRTNHTQDVSGSNTYGDEDPQEDLDAMEIFRQIYEEAPGELNHLDAKPVQNTLERPQSPEIPRSPTSSISCSEHLPVTADRQTEIDRMVEYIKAVIERSNSSKSDGMSAKLKVHEVILVLLLNHMYGDKTMDLRRILAFCDEDGREVSGMSRNFKTLDTETMGALWMKIKGNRKASYDTFARAMRVRREKSTGYFDYLDTGLRSKKRVYRLGDKAMDDMHRIQETLKQF